MLLDSCQRTVKRQGRWCLLRASLRRAACSRVLLAYPPPQELAAAAACCFKAVPSWKLRLLLHCICVPLAQWPRDTQLSASAITSSTCAKKQIIIPLRLRRCQSRTVNSWSSTYGTYGENSPQVMQPYTYIWLQFQLHWVDELAWWCIHFPQPFWQYTHFVWLGRWIVWLFVLICRIVHK